MKKPILIVMEALPAPRKYEIIVIFSILVARITANHKERLQDGYGGKPQIPQACYSVIGNPVLWNSIHNVPY